MKSLIFIIALLVLFALVKGQDKQPYKLPDSYFKDHHLVFNKQYIGETIARRLWNDEVIKWGIYISNRPSKDYTDVDDSEEYFFEVEKVRSTLIFRNVNPEWVKFVTQGTYIKIGNITYKKL